MNRRTAFSWMMVFGLMATLVITAATAEATGRRGLMRRRAVDCCPTPVETPACSACGSTVAEVKVDDEPLATYYYAYGYKPGNNSIYLATHSSELEARRCVEICGQVNPVNIFSFPTTIPVPNCVCASEVVAPATVTYTLEMRTEPAMGFPQAATVTNQLVLHNAGLSEAAKEVGLRSAVATFYRELALAAGLNVNDPVRVVKISMP